MLQACQVFALLETVEFIESSFHPFDASLLRGLSEPLRQRCSRVGHVFREVAPRCGLEVLAQRLVDALLQPANTRVLLLLHFDIISQPLRRHSVLDLEVASSDVNQIGARQCI